MDAELQKHIEYAAGYLDLRMYEDALREVDVVLAQVTDQPQALALKSATLWQANRLPEAEPYLAKLAELRPREVDIWINLAYIRRRTQSLEAAAETLQRAFDANPRDALAHFNMACYRAQQHRTDEALELLKNALQLDPKLKALAKTEPDFAKLRGLPEFSALINRKSA
jgi:tetratricopeptide (TPR) repeat protein